ncbi:MAG: DMT family transporter [Simkaniaceae bacterium]|nr:DMT family transporter [Simkaniaceae bacterium]
MNVGLIFLLYMMWSSMFPLAKLQLEISSPLFLIATRMGLAGIILIGYLLIRKRQSLRLKGREWISIFILALTSIYLTNVFEYYGLKHLSAAKTCFIYSLTPFFSALLSYIHFKERMTPIKWLGMGIGICGMLPVFQMQTGSESLLQVFSIFSLADLAVIAAAFLAIYGWVILRIVVKNRDVSPLVANGLSMLIGSIMALVHSLCVETWNPTPVASGYILPFTAGVAGVTLLSNIICYNLYGYLLRHYTATLMSFCGLLSPVFASFSSWIIIGEPPSPLIFLSTGVVGIGVWVIYREELKQGYITKKAKA